MSAKRKVWSWTSMPERRYGLGVLLTSSDCLIRGGRAALFSGHQSLELVQLVHSEVAALSLHQTHLAQIPQCLARRLTRCARPARQLLLGDPEGDANAAVGGLAKSFGELHQPP